MPSRMPYAEDLQWVLRSPPLLAATWRPTSDALAIDDASPQITAFFAERATRRVGRYFEDLVHCLLLHRIGARQLRRGIQIREHGRTLGELDFVFRDSQGRLIHLETAVKFYLHVGDAGPHDSHYVGPNVNDTLEKKVRRLYQHQLPLSDHPAVRQAIAVGSKEPIEQLAWVCGRIFYHPRESEPRPISPLLAPDHLRGIWLRQSELVGEFERLPLVSGLADCSFRWMEKPFWLSAVSEESPVCLLPELKHRVRAHFAGGGSPIMLDIRLPETLAAEAIQRMIVVADGWPLQS